MRFTEGQTGALAVESWSLADVFGNNVAFNVLRVMVFYLGPIGVALALLGSNVDGFSRMLSASVASVFGLGLLHADYGIHIVGPIHQSEMVVPLTWLSVYGLRRLAQAGGGLGWTPVQAVGVALLGMAVTSGGILGAQLPALAGSNRIQEEVYERLEASVGTEPSVVLAPHFGNLWVTNPTYARRGSWVFAWRAPDPAFSNRSLIFRDRPGAAAKMRAVFPARTLFRIVPVRDAPGWAVIPVPDGEP